MSTARNHRPSPLVGEGGEGGITSGLQQTRSCMQTRVLLEAAAVTPAPNPGPEGGGES